MKSEQYSVEEFEQFEAPERVSSDTFNARVAVPSTELDPEPNSAYFELKRRFSSLVIHIDRLRAKLVGIDTRYRPAPGKWSINEHLGHLVDVDRDIWGPRIHTMLQVRDPYFEDIDQDTLVKEHGWHEASVPQLTAQLMRARWNNAVLVNGLPEEAFKTTARHYSRGVLSLRGILEIMVEHDQHHLDRVRELIAESERRV